jgi:hypothetical protein
VLVVKDFTLIHDKPAEVRSQILSQLRDAYDGYTSRKLGNSETKSYKSRFNLLAGMTPDIEKSWSLNTLGERFLMYRVEIADRRAHARKALDAVRGKAAKPPRAELQEAVKDFLAGLERFVPAVSDETAERIIDLAEILSVCRTYVYRDKNDEMPCLPQAEMASRVAKQLLRLGMSVALVRGRRDVGEDEFRAMRRVAFDSLPTNRRLLLGALYENRGGDEPLETFTRVASRIAKTTVRRELENLAELGAVDREKRQVVAASGKKKADGTYKEVKTMKDYYRLSADFAGYCESVGGIPSPRNLRKVVSADAGEGE